ncbi:MAG: L-threonylcarbamoyladenylate synthase [Defluviitaleaceae bacterium]|nr:L-threonylcarbamoyladenylate synthase [Defluviitaleaceae bacterium]
MLRSGIDSAGDFIRNGGLVVFPTETVYGLGADAFNPDAVAKIYAAKGRPGDNPLILHIANAGDFSRLAHEPPDYAFALIENFWPGPLTLVVRKNPTLPAWLGGHPSGTTETVGIRMPAHPVARALIEASGCAIAAPSANKAGKPSPTSLAHVLEDYNEAERNGIFFLDDSERNDEFIGLESTVIDATGDKPVILRHGGITAEEILSVTNRLPTETANASRCAIATVSEANASRCATEFEPARKSPENPRSPGMKYKHYAPRAEMTILSGRPEKIAEYISNVGAGKIGALVSAETATHLPCPAPPNLKILPLGDDASGDKKIIARNLFANLRKFDSLGVDIIFAEAVCESGIGAAITDRMRKAAEGRAVSV